MLTFMGKRDTDRESDAALWERVARSAKPLHKRRPAPKAATPKPQSKQAVKETAAAAKPGFSERKP